MNNTTTHPCYQRTLCQSTTITGIGLHSGRDVTLTLAPAPVDTGVVFVRTDMDGVQIPMQAHQVTDTTMSSNLANGDARVGTVEHLLSAVAACGIDNLYIQVDAPEIPITDGSATPFIRLIQEVGLAEQPALKPFIKVLKPVRVADGDKWASFSVNHDGLKMHFEIAFDHLAIAATPQQFSLDFNSDNFIREVADARTFGFYKDLQFLRSQNLALGGSLDNAIVMDDTSVMNPEGLRHPDEFVRHKMLDAVGDLYIIGSAIIGEFHAYKSGHALNNALIRALLADQGAYQIVTFDDINACPITYLPAKNRI